jgi:FtsP/CotA-like multicopper oxidase with cupredoxin domain
LVLRGTSPSARLLAHRDIVQPSAPGALRDSASASSVMPVMHDMPNAGGNTRGGTRLAWTMPPMSRRMSMMPGMTGLVPPAVPYLPSVAPPDDSGPPNIRARDGDTISLRAAPIRKTIRGRTVTMFGFNGRSPGPTIDVDQGATITIRVVNAIDAATAIHWHGIRLDNLFDGAAGLTQPAVASGAEFTYKVHFPDAGLYWYHPHVREDVQQSLGLFGNIVVRPTERGYYSSVNRVVPLVLDDLLADSSGLSPFGADTPTHALMGRFGNVFLVNGQERSVVEANAGDIVRFNITNVSPSRFYNISIPGVRMKIVGTDVGKFEREEWVRSVVVAPAERFIVEVRFPRRGVIALVNRVQALDHMIGSYTAETDTLAFVRVDGGVASARTTVAARTFTTLRRNAGVRRDIARFRTYFAKPIDHELVLTLRTQDLPASIANMLQGINAAVEWNDGMPMMNWLTTGKEVAWVLRDPSTGKENMDIGWRFHRGDVVKLRIFNDPSSSHAMAHPIHIHGQRFLVLARDGVKSENLGWKDTTIIPAGETVDLLVDMVNPGQWMLHCHIAEHLSAGMMSAFVVE